MIFKKTWALACLLAALAACGGGGQVEPFDPDRIVAFGDEMSLLVEDEADKGNALKYSINVKKDIADDGTDDLKRECHDNEMWIQVVSEGLDLPFPECSGKPEDAPSRIKAALGATVDDFEAQIADARDEGLLGDRTLALVMVGMNDIYELLDDFDGSNEDALLDEAEARGEKLARLVNDLSQSGPPVILGTAPDVSYSPYVRKLSSDARSLASRLVERFNDALILNINNDGRHIGLFFGDVEVQLIVDKPSSRGFSNASDAACKPEAVLPNCYDTDDEDTTDLVRGAGSISYLWADDKRLSPGYHLRIGRLALSRANNNPF